MGGGFYACCSGGVVEVGVAQGRGGGLGRRGGDGQLEGEGGGTVAGEEVGEIVFQDVWVERLARNEPAQTYKIGNAAKLKNDQNGQSCF